MRPSVRPIKVWLVGGWWLGVGGVEWSGVELSGVEWSGVEWSGVKQQVEWSGWGSCCVPHAAGKMSDV